MNIHLKVTWRKRRGLSLFQVLFILLFFSLSNGMAAKYFVNWESREINEKIYPGESLTRAVTFSINGGKTPISKIKLCVKKNLKPFVSIYPTIINNPIIGQYYSVEIKFSLPVNILPCVIDSKVYVKIIKNNGNKQIIPKKLKILLTVEGNSGDMVVKNSLKYPTRIAYGPGNKLYVSDAYIGSVFIYDSNRNPIGELKNLNRPLGLIVDSNENIYVGNDGRDNIEIYGPTGIKQKTIENVNLKMPNDLELDNDGNIYVVDSLNHTVKVFNSSGQWVRNIGTPGDGNGELKFPVSIVLATLSGDNYVFIADQGHAKIQVFNGQGGYLNSLGEPLPAFNSDWQGKFARLQSMAIDQYGRLHAVDCYLNKIQVFDALTGDFIDSYGEFGTEPGKLNLPLDISIINNGDVIVTNAGNQKVETVFRIE